MALEVDYPRRMRSRTERHTQSVGGRKCGLNYAKQIACAAHYLAAMYVFGASVYGILAFRNFSVGEVVATVFLFSALPLGLILFTATPRNVGRVVNRWATPVLAGVAALVMFSIQFSGLRQAESFLSNFPNHRMDIGGGFHQDTAFHVAIIQGILNTGYPTTGQHLEPRASYHALSHYVDAVALWFLAIDPWESYALLFFAKGVAITLAVVYFAMKAAEPYSIKVFWLTLVIVYPAFTATWHVISSHPQWFPMTVLALSAHRVYMLGMKNRRTWVDYALLTALVVVLSLGKISIGFSFAILVGFWLFFRRPIDRRLIATGIVWVTFLGAYGSSVFLDGASSSPGVASAFARFILSGQEIFAVSLLAILLGIVARLAKTPYLLSLSLGLSGSVVVIALLAIIATENYSDVFYFFHGLFSVALFLSLPLLARGIMDNPQSARGLSGSESSDFRILAFVACMIVSLAPVVSKAQVPPFTSLETTLSTGESLLNNTYIWFNEGKAPDERMSTWRALLGKQSRVVEPDKVPYASELRDSLKDFVEVNNLSNESPLVYLTSEQFELVAARISNPNPLWTGLAVTAVTGLPLVFGVPDPDFRKYRFYDYDESALVRKKNELSDEVLCSFGRPVIIAVDVTTFNFMLACRGK